MILSGQTLIANPLAIAAVDSLGDKLNFGGGVPGPFWVVGWGFALTVALDTTANLLAALDRLVLNGAVRTNAIGGTTLSVTTDKVIGDVLIVEPTSPVKINEGEAAIIEVTQAATAGDGWPFILYQPIGVHPDGSTKVFDVSL